MPRGACAGAGVGYYTWKSKAPVDAQAPGLDIGARVGEGEVV